MKISDVLNNWSTLSIYWKEGYKLVCADDDISEDESTNVVIKRRGHNSNLLVVIKFTHTDEHFHYFDVCNNMRPIIRLFHKNPLTGDTQEDMEVDSLYEYYEEDVMGILSDPETIEIER